MKSKGIAFENLFDPDVIGDGPTAPGYMVNGVPLRFAALKYGTKRANVGYAENGVDVSNKWAAIGTAAYSLAFDGRAYTANASSLTGSGSVRASLALNVRADGTWDIVRANIPGGTATLASGAWHTFGGVAGDYELQIDVTHTGGGTAAGQSNSAANWVPLSTGRGATITLGPYPASDTTARQSIESIRCRIRKASTGAVLSDSTCQFTTQTVGFS